MSAKAQDPEVSNAGITTGADGQRRVAASVRADGSIRKEIKIRPGYRPPEDIEAYKNRTAEAFRNRGQGGVPGAEAVEAEDTKDGSAASNKNAKRREARKRAKEREKEDSSKAEGVTEGDTKSENVEDDKLVDPEAEKEKEAKKLAKKLRQARELKERKEKGDALLPEQFQKVIRINELVRQLDALGFDANGEKKVPTEKT
jgi:partner of Y14 and mago